MVRCINRRRTKAVSSSRFSHTLSVLECVVAGLLCAGFAAGQTTIVAEADAYVQDTAAATNFGSAGFLDSAPFPTPGGGFASRCSDNGNFRSFLRFDLSSVPPTWSILSARLQMTAYAGFAHGGDGTQHVYFVADDTWGEGTITWNNQPAAGPQLGSQFMWFGFPCSLSAKPTQTLSIDVTAQAITEFAGDKRLSVEVQAPGYWVRFRDRTWATAGERPQLALQLAEPIPVTGGWGLLLLGAVVTAGAVAALAFRR